MKDKKIYIQSQTVCEDENGNFWFTSNSFNALFFMDSKTEKIEYVVSFDETENHSDSLYTRAYLWGEKIFFIPCVAEHIAVYDRKKNEVSYINIEKEYIAYNCVKFEENKLLLLPSIYKTYAWILNLEEESLEKINVKAKIDKEILDIYKVKCVLGNGFYKGKSIFVIPETNIVLCFDFTTHEMVAEVIHEVDAFFSTYNCDGRCLITSLDGSKVFSYEDGVNVIKKLAYDTTRLVIGENKTMAYSRIANVKSIGDIVLPVEGNKICILAKLNASFKEIAWNNIKGLVDGAQPFLDVFENNGKLYFFPYQCNTLLIYDYKLNNAEYKELYISEETMLKIDKELFFGKNKADGVIASVIEQKNGIDLKWFLKVISNSVNGG